MPTSSYMPKDDSGKADLLDHVAATLPKYAALLEISPEDLASLQADAVAFRYALNLHNYAQSYHHNCTAFKNQLRDGGTDATLWPIPPLLPEPIPPIGKSGIIPRFSLFVTRLKAHKNYSPAIGQDLQVIGSAYIIDPSTWKPVLSSTSQAGHPTVVWTKGKASAIEIWVDRNDGNGFVFLIIHTEPNTPDPAPLPPPGTSVVWKYKAIYRYHDEQVGEWSDVLSVVVGG